MIVVLLFMLGSFSVTAISYVLGIIGIFSNFSTVVSMLSDFFSSFFG